VVQQEVGGKHQSQKEVNKQNTRENKYLMDELCL